MSPPTLTSSPPPDPTNDSLNPEQDQTHAKLSAEAGPGVSTAKQTFCPSQNHALTRVSTYRGTSSTRAQHGAVGGVWGCVRGGLGMLQIAHHSTEGS